VDHVDVISSFSQESPPLTKFLFANSVLRQVRSEYFGAMLSGAWAESRGASEGVGELRCLEQLCPIGCFQK